MYISDYFNNRIRKVTVSTGIIITIAGTGTSSDSGDNGQATSAKLNTPVGVSVDTSGYDYKRPLIHIIRLTMYYLGNVYIADMSNHRIRKVTVSTGIITTFAGTGSASYSGDNGLATSATLYYPSGVALDSSGRGKYLVFLFLIINLYSLSAKVTCILPISITIVSAR